MNTDESARQPANRVGSKPDAHDEAIEAKHETTDVSVRGLTFFFVSLAVVLTGAFVVIALVFRIFGAVDTYVDKSVARNEPGAASQVQLRADYDGPALQVVPEEDLKAMNAANDATLDHYGWVDKQAGVVRLPIDRAISLVAERGIPPVSPGQTVESIQQQRAQPQVYGQVLRP